MPSSPNVPSATLVPVTDEARAALGNKDEIRMTRFPLNVGRESRVGTFDKLKAEIERRFSGAPQLNDVYLIERPSFSLHISREHFAIGYADGRFVLLDRESACGTIVAGIAIGSEHTERQIELRDGDVITVGTADSPYKFRFKIGS